MCRTGRCDSATFELGLAFSTFTRFNLGNIHLVIYSGTRGVRMHAFCDSTQVEGSWATVRRMGQVPGPYIAVALVPGENPRVCVSGITRYCNCRRQRMAHSTPLTFLFLASYIIFHLTSSHSVLLSYKFTQTSNN